MPHTQNKLRKYPIEIQLVASSNHSVKVLHKLHIHSCCWIFVFAIYYTQTKSPNRYQQELSHDFPIHWSSLTLLLRDFQSFLAIESIDCTRSVSFASFLSRKDLLRCRLRGKTFNIAHTTQHTVSFFFAFFSFLYLFSHLFSRFDFSLHPADMYTLLRWSMTLCTSSVSYSSLLTTLNWIDAYLSPEWIKFPAS